MPSPKARACLSSVSIGALPADSPSAGKSRRSRPCREWRAALEVPDCARIQAMTSFSTSVTMNMRSASLRCAIEMMEMRGLPSRREQQSLRVEWLALIHVAKPGEAMQVVDAHRELESLFRREEGLEVEGADLVEGRFLHRLDESRQVERSVPVAMHPRGCWRAGCVRGYAMGSASMPSRLSIPDDHRADTIAQRARRPPAARAAAARTSATPTGAARSRLPGV